jgi:alpha/beta superfamily hydrolase
MIENQVKVGQKRPHVAETTLQAKHFFTEKLA